MTHPAEHRSVFLPGGLRLHVVNYGLQEGDPVLLLHGWPQTSYAWRRVGPLLAAAGLRVIAPDLRGFGDSSRPEIGFDKKTVARDLHELLCELAIERAWVVGHDMGGHVAYPFAAQGPDMVRGLVFI
ncbi:alpha/beta fold hydrolase [Xanthobacter sp. V2C-8]|uniref:alpha/beta fold hydrolase n=1 Tax=Xanthobacter albus TaxID=3119929 RepID=UPI0037278AC4